jgi:hypothetical protein
MASVSSTSIKYRLRELRRASVSTGHIKLDDPKSRSPFVHAGIQVRRYWKCEAKSEDAGLIKARLRAASWSYGVRRVEMLLVQEPIE